MPSALSAAHLQNEEAAYAYVEARVWPEGPICPHCGCMGRIYAIKANAGAKVRIGLKKCGDCRKQFTVKVGTVFESSHVALHLWLQAMALITSSKKGINSNQLSRVLGVTLKTAWFMSHRIREAMREGDLAPFGSGGGDVEVDETYIGREPGEPNQHVGWADKMKVLSLIDRDTGRARSIVMDFVTSKTVGEIVAANMATEARLITDKAIYYRRVGKTFAAHESVNHGTGEYVSKLDPTVHTNTVEGFYSIFKRGMRGVYQHCGKKHLHRYMAEFDFRYSHRIANGADDAERASRALNGIVGKRLTYQTARGWTEGAQA